MPTSIQKTSSGKYRVSTPHGTKAKGTTKQKAQAQKRLLNAVEHGFKPTPKSEDDEHMTGMGKKMSKKRMQKMME